MPLHLGRFNPALASKQARCNFGANFAVVHNRTNRTLHFVEASHTLANIFYNVS